MLPLTSLRIEEVIFKNKVIVYEYVVVMETCICHGRDVIRMRTKLWLHLQTDISCFDGPDNL